ncbi:MAG: hypothetical protein RBJ76_24535 [Stenomitos frigidus ULC029]
MTRLRFPRSVILSTTIATLTLLLSSAIVAQACPLADGGISLSQTLRQPDMSDRSAVVSPSGSPNRQAFGYMDIASLGGIVGLFAIALLYKVHRSHALAPAEAEFLNRFPQFEHPELALTIVPSEALPSYFEREPIAVR